MKQLRQRAIRDLLEQRPIRTQQELAAAPPRARLPTTQATISRDVAELGLIKVAAGGTVAYALPPRLIEAETSGEDRLRKLLRDLPVEFREAGLLLVLRTLPGSAHAIAAALDRARWPEVAGSIAGDDTLFVAFTDRLALRLGRLTCGNGSARGRAGGRTGRRSRTALVAALTPRRRRDYHSPPAELQVRGSADTWSSFLFISPRPGGRRPRDAPRRGSPAVNTKPTYLSRDGLEKLRVELGEMTNVRRAEVATRIHDAKEHGDLSENAEYEDAKNEQAFVEGRIQTLEALIKNATIIDEKHSTDHVQIGSTVTVESGDGNETFTIVGSDRGQARRGPDLERVAGRAGAPRSQEGRQGRRPGPRRRLQLHDRVDQPGRPPAVEAGRCPAGARTRWTGPTSWPPRSAARRSSTTARRRPGRSTSAACAGRSSSTRSPARCAPAASRRRCSTASTTSTRWTPRRS